MTNEAMYSSKLIKECKRLEHGRSGNEVKLNMV